MTTAEKTLIALASLTTGEFSIPYKLEYSETKKGEKEGEKGERVKIGEIDIKIPNLADLGFNAEVKEVGKDGIPTYANADVQFIYDCILAKVFASLRSRIIIEVSKNEKGEEVKSLAWREGTQEFTVAGVASTGEQGAWRKILAELKQDWKAFLTSLNIQTVVLNTYVNMLEKPEISPGVVLANPKAGEGFIRNLNKFAESLAPEKIQRFQKHMEKAEAAIPTKLEEAQW